SSAHLKEHHPMGRNYLAHASGDAINAVLAAAGYNFRRLLAWLRLLLLRILIAFSLTTQLKSVRNRVLHGRRFKREPDPRRAGDERLERPLRLHLLSPAVRVQPVWRPRTLCSACRQRAQR